MIIMIMMPTLTYAREDLLFLLAAVNVAYRQSDTFGSVSQMQCMISEVHLVTLKSLYVITLI